ncbi:hypothetical protein BIW22_24860 [Salmonella enterica]|nr:hypothetical protein [Salmonella enterica]EFO7976644.1 hypothetical protein [Salmonella enterica]
MSILNTEQKRFYDLVSKYPNISALWDWNTASFRVEDYEKALKVMSSREVTLARFFAGLWSDEHSGVGLFDVVQLDRKEREMIIRWMEDPFWP